MSTVKKRRLRAILLSLTGSPAPKRHKSGLRRYLSLWALTPGFAHRDRELLEFAGADDLDRLGGANLDLAEPRIQVFQALGRGSVQRHDDETALIVPNVALRLPGRPIASTICPGLRSSTLARGSAGADSPSTLSSARSVAGSRPTSVALVRLSSTTTSISSSCSTTWFAVRTSPLSQTMPVPARPRRAST